MKSEEYLYRAIQCMGSNQEVEVNLTKYFESKIKIKKKTSIQCKDFLISDSCIDYERGIFYDAKNKVAVSTDGHVMFMSKKEYNEEYAGKIIDKKGCEVETKYPKYENAIPSKDIIPLKIKSSEQIRALIAKAKLDYIMKYGYGTMDRICIQVLDNKETERWLDIKYATLLMNNLDRFAWGGNKNYRCALLGNNKTEQIVIMPFNLTPTEENRKNGYSNEP